MAGRGEMPEYDVTVTICLRHERTMRVKSMNGSGAESVAYDRAMSEVTVPDGFEVWDDHTDAHAVPLPMELADGYYWARHRGGAYPSGSLVIVEWRDGYWNDGGEISSPPDAYEVVSGPIQPPAPSAASPRS